jgi:cysteinyl-tRNA synthetase
MSLKIYNTLTGKKEEFVPQNPPQVKMYVCGVTVYDDCHIGHARGALTFDIIRNYLKYKGYEVTYVRNITDIDDKIIQRANELKCAWDDIAKQYTGEYYHDMEKLGIQKADIEPKATEHIADMFRMINQLIDKGYAYVVEGDVYFEVRKFAAYGKLSGRKPDDMLAGARIEVDERKRDPLDFALWKSSKPGEPWWESPWGKGRPGWHIECSVMSTCFLGASLDIHGGGKDLIFPHHENEIAQSEAASGQPFAKYWIHNGFVQVNQEKMSKSLGNFFTIKEILAKYPPEVVRFFLLSTHYRSPIDFSDERLEEAKRGLERFYNTFKDVDLALKGQNKKDASSPETDNYRIRFEAAMDDDFNTAEALGVLFELARHINKLIRHKATPQLVSVGNDLLRNLGTVLGLFGIVITPAVATAGIGAGDPGVIIGKPLPSPEEEIKSLIEQRNQARARKDWAAADAIRKKLWDIGIILEDRPEGTIWWVKT